MATKVEDKRTEVAFGDYKPLYDAGQALAEANRCLYCEDAPCITACPTGINIPEFIRKIATDNIKGSARTIFESNIMGMSCARVCPVEVLCVGDCVYNHMGIPPIQIGKLQRYSTDIAFEKDWRYFEAGPDTGKSVALIGGGPASLAAAHELRRQGHACTIYEKRGVLGGLNTYGVAPYKMKADRAVEEVAWILEIGGIDIKTGVEIGVDVTWADLEAQHDAIFVGIGLGPDKWLQELLGGVEGAVGAVDIIEQMKLSEIDIDSLGDVLVVGGGNTAIDVVREMSDLGVQNVTMVYRGDEPGMSGYKHEWDWAKRGGAKASWRTQPIGHDGDGKIEGLRCVKLDANKKPIDESTFVLPADLVVLAIGQSKIGDLIGELDGVTLDWGRVVVAEDGSTGRPGLYAGGDCANGGKEVVNAVAEGKRAAQAIDRYLGGN